MAQGKVTPVKGSKLLVQTGVSETPETIDSVTATNPGTIDITATTLVKGDIVTISGVGEGFDGEYAVSDVATGTVTLAGADWSDLVVPGSITGAEAAKHEFSANWCEVNSFNRAGGTIDQTDVSTFCSARREYDPGLADSGTIQFNFNYAPATTVQNKFKEYENSASKFWIKHILPRDQGTMLYYGSIQTGVGAEGSTGGVYTSSVTIQLSGDYYRIAA